MLKHETEERSLPTWHTPTRVNQGSVSRTDAEEILQRAARLQNDELERVSFAELEALAVERGISPRFVRQAMEIPGYQHLPASSKRMRLEPVRLTRLQWQVCTAAVVLYWLAGTTTPVYSNSNWAYYSAYPLFIALGLGYFLRYKRAGIVAGLALLVANWFGIVLVSEMSSSYGLRIFPMLLVPSTIIAWAGAGTVGAALRQWAATRQLPFEPTVLTPPASDR